MPFSTPTPRSARFWDRIAQKYAADPVADEAAYQRKLRETQALMHKDMQVLEFGCGTGTTALTHAPHVAHILATDISANMLEIAAEKARQAGITNVTFERAGFDEVQQPVASFDMILCLSILHLVEDRDEALAQVFTLLKPGGYLVSSTACLGDFLRIFKLIGPIGKALGYLPLVMVFRRTELLDSIRQAGFEIETEWQPSRKQGTFVIARKPGA